MRILFQVFSIITACVSAEFLPILLLAKKTNAVKDIWAIYFSIYVKIGVSGIGALQFPFVILCCNGIMLLRGVIIK